MPRYAKQRDGFSCGPTALINALKWAGFSVSYVASRQEWIQKCRTTKNGTPPFLLGMAISEHLHRHNITYSVRTASDLRYARYRQEILAHTRKDGAALVRFDWPNEDFGHYFLIVSATQHYLDVVNLYSTGPAKRRIHRRTLLALLARQKMLWCWLLTRR